MPLIGRETGAVMRPGSLGPNVGPPDTSISAGKRDQGQDEPERVLHEPLGCGRPPRVRLLDSRDVEVVHVAGIC